MTSIKIKNSVVPGKKPLPTDLEQAELAINLADRAIYTKDQTDTVVELTNNSHVVSNSEPVQKDFGDVWVDTNNGIRTVQVWDGANWRGENELLLPPDTIAATFKIRAEAGAVGLTCTPTGQTDADCAILWGDGSRSTGVIAGTHTYATPGEYQVIVLLSPATAILDGGGWPALTNAEWLEFGPFTNGTVLNKMGPDTVDGNGDELLIMLELRKMDFRGCTIQQDQNWGYLFAAVDSNDNALRPGLHPSNVLGVDTSKIVNVEYLCYGRSDIHEVPWPDLPRCTNMSKHDERLQFSVHASCPELS